MSTLRQSMINLLNAVCLSAGEKNFTTRKGTQEKIISIISAMQINLDPYCPKEHTKLLTFTPVRWFLRNNGDVFYREVSLVAES